jgi:hypothetical protein
MTIIRRHYKGVTKQYGLAMWGTKRYTAFDLYIGRNLFVLGFERDK